MGPAHIGDDARHPRVLMLVENAPVPGDRRVTEEARALVANGYDVSVICPAIPAQRIDESLDGIAVHRYRPYVASGGVLSQVTEYAVALVKTFWMMLGQLADPGFDVIIAANPPDLFFLIVWPFRLMGKRFIFDQHDLTPELFSALYRRDSGVIVRVLRWCERRTYGISDAVIACNESYRRIASTRGGVEPERIFVVRNGPREGWPFPVPADESLKRGRAHLVVYMGVMGYQDGVDVLLQSIRILVRDLGMTGVLFAIVGDGNAAASLHQLAADLGLNEFVEFTGWIGDEAGLSRYLRTADACVSPEPSSPLNDHSTFIKVMQYMASGTPIVAFDLPESRVSAGDAAVYAESGDVTGFAEAIRRVLTDDALRQSMVASATERISQLRWERQIPPLLAALECALSPQRRPKPRGRAAR
jgi:glycosyltransferase involved in cell wall biosynthesis